MNICIYRYIEQTFLFNNVIKSHYQETKKKKPTQQPKRKDLLPALNGVPVRLPHKMYPHVEMRGYQRRKINPLTWQINAAGQEKEKYV